MKYIRTKDDRIVAIPNNSKLVLYDDEKLIIDTTKKGQTCVYGLVEKQADTIEELCDGWVYRENGDVKGVYLKKYNFDLKRYTTLLIDNPVGEIVLFIETDKGLIYVAKMNSKGELELL